MKGARKPKPEAVKPAAVTGFDVHSHKCKDPGCGAVWTHERLRGVSEERYEQAHACPDCGQVQYFRYFGSGSAPRQEIPEGRRPQNPLRFFQLMAEVMDYAESMERRVENKLEDLDGEDGHDLEYSRHL